MRTISALSLFTIVPSFLSHSTGTVYFPAGDGAQLEQALACARAHSGSMSGRLARAHCCHDARAGHFDRVHPLQLQQRPGLLRFGVRDKQLRYAGNAAFQQ